MAVTVFTVFEVMSADSLATALPMASISRPRVPSLAGAVTTPTVCAPPPKPPPIPGGPIPGGPERLPLFGAFSRGANWPGAEPPLAAAPEGDEAEGPEHA